MGTKKKKSGKPKKQPQFKGHYCKICGEHKANEKFSGKGHAAHICKACASKSPAQKSEDMTINRLHGMAFRYLSQTEMNWLRNRRSDSRPEVRELAQQVFEIKFPRQARNEIKARLHIRHIAFRVRGELYDGYGDQYIVNAEYVADTSGRIVKKMHNDNGNAVVEASVDSGVKAARKFFNVMVHNYDMPFWDTDLCLESSDDLDIDLLTAIIDGDDFEDYEDGALDENDAESSCNSSDDTPDEKTPTWSVEIKYKNDTEQSIKGYDYLPDPVMELAADFESYFADEFSDGEFDEDDIYNGDISE